MINKKSKWLALLLSCAMTVSSVSAPMAVAAESEMQTEAAIEEITESAVSEEAAVMSEANEEAERQNSISETEKFPEAETVTDSADSEETETQQTEAAITETLAESEIEESQDQTEAVTETETEIETETVHTQKTITGIIALEASILNQEVEQGVGESEICFPETLQATVTDAEGEKEESLSVEWKLSNAEAFSSEEADAVFTYTAKLSEEYEISENVKLPEITVTIKEATEAFDQSTIIDNIKITVKADEGVFPKDSSLKAVKIDGSAKEELKDAVEEIENPDGNSQIEEEILEALEDADLPAELAEVAETSKEEFHAFDITILDKDGNEIQPDNSKGQVSVSFSNPNPEFATSEYTVYHQDEASGVIEELPTATNSENMMEAEATSFSPYMLSILTGNTQLSVTRLTGAEAELDTGIYYVDGDLLYTGKNADSSTEIGGNGLKIKNGASVYIYIGSGGSLTANGGNGYDATASTDAKMGNVVIGKLKYLQNANGTWSYIADIEKKDGAEGKSGLAATAGGAGIYVPSNGKLTIFGEGMLAVTGGNGGNGQSGSNGAFTKAGVYSSRTGKKYPLTGYIYGYATTGTALINGGSGQTEHNDYDGHQDEENFSAAVGAGGAGGSGAAGGGAGIGSNGTSGTPGTNGATGFVDDELDADIKKSAASVEAAVPDAVGTIYIKGVTTNIQGGKGGEARSNTKSQTARNTVSYYSYFDQSKNYLNITHGQPGGNGAAGGDGAAIGMGGKGGTGGSGGDSGSIRTSYNQGVGVSGYAGTSNPGSNGTAGDNGNGSSSSLDDTNYPYNTVTFRGASSNATQNYYLNQNGTVTAPDYTPEEGKYFDGWKVTTAASVFPVGVQGTELIREGQIYPAGAKISTQGIYGNVVLEPIITDHHHSWTYEVDPANTNTILAYCTDTHNATSCDYQGKDHAVKLTIEANDAAYTGTTYASSNVSVANAITSITGATAGAVTYYADAKLTETVTPQNVGTYYAAITLGEKTAVDKFEITKKQITIPAEDTTSYTYSGAEQTYVLAASSDYDISNDKRTDAGSQTVTVSLKDKNNTEWTDQTTKDKTYTFTIAKADPNLTVGTVSDKTYGDEAFDLTVTNRGDAAPTYQSSDEKVLSVKDGKVTLHNAGKATVTVSVAETNNYLSDKKTVEITVNKKAGSLTVSKMEYQVTYGDAAFSVEGLNKVGDSEVTYQSSDESVVTVDADGKISNHKVGKATITLSMAGVNYTSASVEVSVTVVPKEITVTADSLSKTYKEKDPELTWKANTLVGQDKLENISIRRTAGEDAGKYAVTVEQTAGSNSNYKIKFVDGTFTIQPKAITVTADKKSKIYGSDDPELTWKAVGVAEGDELKHISAKRDSGQNVGTYAITLSQTEGANANYKISFVDNTFTIDAKTAKVIVDDKTKTYGDKDAALTYQTEGLVKGESVAVTVSREAGEDVGTYKITAAQADGANSNYAITFVDGTYTINKKAATVIAEDQSKTYGDPDAKLTYKAEGLVKGDSLEKITLSRKAGEDVGTYAITAVQADGANKNYDLTFKAGTYTIGQKAITVTAEDASKTYGAADPVLTYKADGLVGTDTLSDISATRKSGENVGTYTITASQKDGSNSNYKIMFADGTFTIHPKNVTLAAKDITINGDGSFVYEGTEKKPTVVVLDGDKVIPASEYTVSYKNNVNASKDVTDEAEKPVVIITDNEGGNYVVNGSKIFEIAKADPELSVSAVPDKTYGDEAFALEVTKKGESTPTFASSDDKVLTVDKNGKVTLVGAGKATVTVAMAESRNYNAKDTTVEINVQKKDASLTVAQIVYEVTYGDADFTISGITSEGETGVQFTNSDDSVVTVDENGKISIRKVGEAEITLSMTESANYKPISEKVTVKVAPKAITVTADDKTKTYGDKDAELTYTTVGLVGSDELEKISLTRKEGEDVGTYLITAVQEEGANSNYAITFQTGTCTIVPKDITGAAVELDGTLTYNGKEQEQNVKSVVIDGLQATFDVTDNKATNAGEYVLKITGNGNFTGTIEQKFTIAKQPGDITFEVETDGSAPQTTIQNSEQEMIAMLADAEELAAIEAGDSLKIWVEITDASATISEASKQLIRSAASDYQVGAYIDISLFKKLATADKATRITGTNKLITVSVTIPENLRSDDPKVKRTYAVVRVHDGVAEILPTTQNGNTLTFTTDKFSDYAIMYKDENVSDDNGGDNNSGNNNSGSNNNGSTGTTSTTASPQTGDETNIMLWVLLMMLGLSGMVGAGIYRRKSSKNV